ncbi:unnamed protein product [Adineta ricciae]|uniref:Enoyl reductase (ER) domain-containing protein n=3 Tax=Adineta ricciae TaxID=249248 RepID=A0A815JBF9_ADIRI|nr:unnamed protein product [Adineta ricciae]
MTEDNVTTSNNEIPYVMRAAQQINYGNVRDVLQLDDNVSVPRELTSKQVLIRVYAASINPADCKLLYGDVSFAIRYSFPHIPGGDVAGVVVDVGSAVGRVRIGDHVYGNLGTNGGGYAEYARAEESMLAIKPTNLTMEEAAAIPLACETSYEALFQRCSSPVGKGTKLFICGGGSATGLFAIQLAKAVGAFVALTCSQRNLFLIEKLGYEIIRNKSEWINMDNQILVIDYKEKDFGEELQGNDYDIVCDCVGGQQNWISAQRILKRGGDFITFVGDDPNPVLSVTWIVQTAGNLLNRKFWSVFGSERHKYFMHVHSQTPENLDDLRLNYFESGKVKPIIDKVYDWRKDGIEALYSAYERSRNRMAQGKLILKIADENSK